MCFSAKVVRPLPHGKSGLTRVAKQKWSDPGSLAEEFAGFCLQQGDQFRLHKGVVVGNVEADGALAIQGARNFSPRRFRCRFSMTKMIVDQAICSDDSGTVGSPPKRAESVSTSGQLANTCSAVGLRKRLWLQMHSARLVIDYWIFVDANIPKLADGMW